MDKKRYSELVKEKSPNSHTVTDCLKAFLVGGGICALGEVLFELYKSLGLEEKQGRTMVSLSLILLASTLTALGIFPKVAKFAGAGTLVPITGFANAVTSAAIEFRSEGFILGMGAKMLTIAGPVIVYGTLASVVYGVIYWITTLFQ